MSSPQQIMQNQFKSNDKKVVTNKLKYEQKNYRIEVYVEEKGR